MALSASGVYYLTGDQLRESCVERGLNSDGPVRALRRRLAEYLRGANMDGEGDQDDIQASAQTDLLQTSAGNIPPTPSEVSQHGSDVSQTPVLVELLRQVVPLSSEEPEEILRLFVRLGEVYELGLVDDRQFVTRILPLVSGSVMKFLGSCLRGRCSWDDCKSQLLEEFFPHFVRERLVRDLIVFRFHAAGQSMRGYIEQVFQAANFLKYEATEQQLVERVLMNFHPDVLAKAAFLDRPRSLNELYRAVGLIEEKISVSNERQRAEPEARRQSGGAGWPRDVPRTSRRRQDRAGAATTKCWSCGEPGHYQRSCPQRTSRPGNRQGPGGHATPGPST